MTFYPIIRATCFFTGLLGFLASLMAAPSDAQPVKKECEKKVVIMTTTEQGGCEKHMIKLDGADLKDGETRTIQEGERTITMTRKGEEILVNVDGKTIEVPADCAKGKHTEKIIVMAKEKDGEKEEHVKVKVCGGQDQEMQVIDLDGKGLKEGEARVIDKDGHKIMIVRKNGHIEVQVDGKAITVPCCEGEGRQTMKFIACDTAGKDPEGKEVKLEKHMKMVVIKGDGKDGAWFADGDCADRVEETINGLAEGETKTIQSGPHTLVVSRKDGAITITLDGEQLSSLPLEGKDPKAIKVVTCTSVKTEEKKEEKKEDNKGLK